MYYASRKLTCEFCVTRLPKPVKQILVFSKNIIYIFECLYQVCKNVLICLFSVYGIISLGCHEQMRLSVKL